MRQKRKLREYARKHPLCEACGRPGYGLPNLIRNRDAGGTTDEGNLLRLCLWHRSVVSRGPICIQRLIEEYPHLRGKVLKARPTLAAVMLKERL